MDRAEKLAVAKAVSCIAGQVTVGDIVEKTGLPVLCVNRCLNSLAYECSAHLEVRSDGKIVYSFPSNILLRSKAGAFNRVFSFALRLMLNLFVVVLKVVIGSTLFVSIVLVYSICFLALEVVSVFFNMEAVARKMFREFFAILIQLVRNSHGKDDKRLLRLPPILENCYAFLFGPADPNVVLEKERWLNTAKTIRANNGIVVPEQIRVWALDTDFEKFDLEALVRLDGMPVVTESASIAYYFPSLEKEEVDSDSDIFELDAHLEERTWHFSGIKSDDLAPVMFLAILNFVGANFMYFTFGTLPSVVTKPLAFGLLTALWMYGNAFLLFPLVRFLICAYRNHKITERNVERKLLADSLTHPDRELKLRLKECRETAKQIAVESSKKETVFSTREDALEQFIMNPQLG